MRKRRRLGIFISFEGVDGAGKSTLIQALKTLLAEHGHTVFVTREPGGGELGEAIRDILLNFNMNREAEILLYEAARSNHVQTKILPKLKAGNVVLCDRYTDSSLAYQAFARGLPWNTVKMLNDFATDGLTPAISVFVDEAPKKALRSVKVKTRFEREGLAFQKKVRLGFLKAIRENPKRWIWVQARSGTPENMARELLGKLSQHSQGRVFKL